MVFAQVQTAGDGRTMCQHVYPDNSEMHFWIAMFRIQLVLVGLVIPGLLLLVCYCVIISRLTRAPLGSQRQKRRAVWTIMILVSCFFLCWLPYGVGIFIDALVHLGVLPWRCNLDLILMEWLYVTEPMAYVHCCLNPLLYAFLGADFKLSTRRAF